MTHKESGSRVSPHPDPLPGGEGDAVGSSRSRGERGQILMIVAAGMFFVMLGATSLALDWGNGLLQKRRLQNMADAAALAASNELTRGGTIASAVSVAQGIVTANSDGAVSLPYPANGSGPTMAEGIDITSDGDVRVVLARQVKTMFASVAGVSEVTVRARSRASAGPFGVLPIAVKRFSAGNTAFLIGEGGNPSQVVDNLMPAQDSAGQPNYITSWPAPLTTPASVAPDYSPPGDYRPRISGPVVPLVGRRAIANVANGMDFHFFVAPDVRGITQLTPDLYNGVTLDSLQSAQELKNTSLGYILAKGYPGPNPLIEQQLGTFSGAPTDQAVDAMRKVYRRGDVIAAMIYDGTVYRKPSFNLQLDSAIKSFGSLGAGETATFQVTVVPINNFSSSGVQFWATGLEGWADWSFDSGADNSTYTTSVPAGGTTVSFKVTSSGALQGARTALISAFDPASGTLRTASATLVIGSLPCFSVSSAEAFKTVEQGSATRFDLDLRGWNSYPTTDVLVDPPVWYDDGGSPLGTPPSGINLTLPSTVRVRNGQTANLRVNVDVTSTAPIGQWMIKIRLRDPGDSSRNQSMFVTLQVLAADTNPTVSLTSSFVKVLGYASFVITYADNASTPSPSLDSNTIYGYAVSPLVSDPALLVKGTRARLMGWNQTR